MHLNHGLYTCLTPPNPIASISSSVILLRPSSSSSSSAFQVLLLQRSSSLQVKLQPLPPSLAEQRPASVPRFLSSPRHQVAPSFFVFPGGSLEASDRFRGSGVQGLLKGFRVLRTCPCCCFFRLHLSDFFCSHVDWQLAFPPPLTAHRAAAARETAEEAGLLLTVFIPVLIVAMFRCKLPPGGDLFTTLCSGRNLARGQLRHTRSSCCLHPPPVCGFRAFLRSPDL